ncbi:hypothetical protein AGLY_001605 [Aphis glycines]|uniref:Uncharacterized protein n=1 Tax=Aphis glycines TaxID=307491 RepID=A0A6G0U879_APHGL|nr:hypothetical protein AGLY_001605 [Aphis glycines]
MQNVSVTSEDGEKTPKSAASITEPIMKPQLEKVSAVSENAPTIKRPYGSMPNITASITTAGDDTAAIQAPTAVAVQQQVSAEPQTRYNIELVNAAVMMVPPAARAGEVESRSPSVSSNRQVSAAEPSHDGSGESDAKIRGFAGLPPRILWYSMPNIAIHYTDKVFYNTTEIECIAPMLVSCDSLTGSTTTVTEPAEVSPVKIKRRSLWKRAKKFARRVFCCAT